MVEVKSSWIGKSYFEYFDHLLWTEHLLAVGIFRLSNVELGNTTRRSAYVYTAPPGKETTMFQGDSVICFKKCSTDVNEKRAGRRRNAEKGGTAEKGDKGTRKAVA